MPRATNIEIYGLVLRLARVWSGGKFFFSLITLHLVELLFLALHWSWRGSGPTHLIIESLRKKLIRWRQKTAKIHLKGNSPFGSECSKLDKIIIPIPWDKLCSRQGRQHRWHHQWPRKSQRWWGRPVMPEKASWRTSESDVAILFKLQLRNPNQIHVLQQFLCNPF